MPCLDLRNANQAEKWEKARLPGACVATATAISAHEENHGPGSFLCTKHIGGTAASCGFVSSLFWGSPRFPRHGGVRSGLSRGALDGLLPAIDIHGRTCWHSPHRQLSHCVLLFAVLGFVFFFLSFFFFSRAFLSPIHAVPVRSPCPTKLTAGWPGRWARDEALHPRGGRRLATGPSGP